VTAAALEVTDLVKRYGARTAVDGLTFAAHRGAVTALLGPNGAGKTTTIECAEGFRVPDAGSVRVLGHDPRDQAVKVRIGVMPQTGGGYPGLRAGELLRLVASFHRDPLPPEELLERLGLQDVARTPFRRLSGGQQQRLSLAMAIVGRPELVFLDEPTAGLDPQARRATWELIDALRTDGVAVVLTTHLLDEAEALADHVVVIDHGHLLREGTVAELTAHGADGQLRFTAVLGLDVDALAAALPPGCRVSATEGSYLVEGVVGPQLLADVTAWCARQDVLIREARVEQRSLEDVFLDLTGKELRS
jgi:ABC-2 type transport system ATP-binding protein